MCNGSIVYTTLANNETADVKEGRLTTKIRVDNLDAIHPTFRVPPGKNHYLDDAVRAASWSVGVRGLEPPTSAV